MEVVQQVMWRTGRVLVRQGHQPVRRLALLAPHREGRGVTSQDLDAGGVRATWVAPVGAQAPPVVLYLHGGAYVCCSVDTHRPILERLARRVPARVLALDYRLAPEHPFPAALDDALAAYRWLLREGVDPSRLAVAGDSAGGGLALCLLLALKQAGEPLPSCAAVFSPWTDLAATGWSVHRNNGLDYLPREALGPFARLYLGDTDPRTPLASPLYGDLRGLPPLLVQAGSAELLEDDARRFTSRARDAGVDVELEVWDDMFHVWHAFLGLVPDAARALDRAAAFLRRHVGSVPGEP
jgi:acetyl esterase/lipase